MNKALTLGEFQDARQEAERHIHNAVQWAMDEFQKTTGLPLVDVTVNIAAHASNDPRAMGGVRPIVDNAFLTGVSVKTPLEKTYY